MLLPPVASNLKFETQKQYRTYQIRCWVVPIKKSNVHRSPLCVDHGRYIGFSLLKTCYSTLFARCGLAMLDVLPRNSAVQCISGISLEMLSSQCRRIGVKVSMCEKPMTGTKLGFCHNLSADSLLIAFSSGSIGKPSLDVGDAVARCMSKRWGHWAKSVAKLQWLHVASACCFEFEIWNPKTI